MKRIQMYLDVHPITTICAITLTHYLHELTTLTLNSYIKIGYNTNKINIIYN